MTGVVFLLFFLSGVSGLVYQLAWVRAFGNAFGNTIHSASLVIAVFMCGLGVGSVAAGFWADRRPARSPWALVRAYGWCELMIAALGLVVLLVLPRLDHLSAAVSSYRQDATGWYVLSAGSYLARYGVAVVLLAPITAAMGATLILLIRYLVRHEIAAAGWRIGALYGVNTLGAAVGCLLTGSVFVPTVGLTATQMIAVFFNLVAGWGALHLASASRPDGARRESSSPATARGASASSIPPARPIDVSVLGASAVALACSGFAAMGLELVWLRHIECLVGSYQAVLSLLLTVVLCGLWLGAVVAGALHRRYGRPTVLWAASQALLGLATLAGIASADIRQMFEHVNAVGPAFLVGGEWRRWAIELWVNAQPILREVALPAFLMGFTFPLANAMVQTTEGSVGRRAAALYLANTLGAVAGASVTGFVLLPRAGMQQSVTILVGTIGLGIAAIGAVAWVTAGREGGRWRLAAVAASGIIMSVGLLWWMTLPRDYVVARTLWPLAPGERRLAVAEGLTEIVWVTEAPGGAHGLRTNGFSMSGTNLAAQRYMRAFAHVPLLMMDAPDRVLVVCFGVGTTAHAASLHSSVQRLEIVDTSREILGFAGRFAATNRDVLRHPAARVYVNDGRQHLRMQEPEAYALITLEPPPISHAGVASLYSREFYELAKSRLKPGGTLTQWLPAYQVPAETTLSMVRAFVDVFPRSVLLSGFGAELILLGVNGPSVEIDPDRIAAKLRAESAVGADLARVHLGSVLEIVGTFAASGPHLDKITEAYPAVTDDNALPEYAVASRVVDHSLPRQLFDVDGVTTWCPTCFTGGKPQPGLEVLPAYLGFLATLYGDPLFLEFRSLRFGEEGQGAVPGAPIGVPRHPYLAGLIAHLRASR